MVRRDNKKAALGFTLMELLVVISIIAIVVAATIPIISGLMRSNHVKQAQNMVTAYMASGRATALAMHTPVAVVFFTDRNPAFKQPRPAVQLLRQISFPSNTNEAHFAAIPERPVEYLPEGIDVVSLSDMPGGELQSANSFHHCRAVLFSDEGQVLVRNGLVGDNPDWGLEGKQAFGNANTSMDNGVSSPGVIVYDARELANKGLTGAAAEDWILKNGDVLLVNMYTGNVIR